ncbi:MAG: DUF4243 domain-containing protein [Actinobacteria bacterium]|nr:DUF4243 domain-containing protein [Actinomycetota bacterium]
MSETLDEALEILHDTGPEFSEDDEGGLSNHGPMAAEALCALGREDEVIGWVEGYIPRLQEHPSAGEPVGDAWHEALGEYARLPDWIALFDGELAEGDWQETLNTWVARLAPGLAAAATHGLIRTAHAARSLGQSDVPGRRHELAEGLAYWAARYQQLPGKLADSPSRLAPSDALRRVKRLEVRSSGLISDDLRGLDELPGFAGVVNLVDPSPDPARFLSEMTLTFARAYLETVSSGRIIGMIHSVTGPSALRLLMPHIELDTAATASRFAWQTGAGIYAALAGTSDEPFEVSTSLDIEDLVDQAVATGDEHAIKFMEACIREHALNPDPIYLTAASDAATRLAADYDRQVEEKSLGSPCFEECGDVVVTRRHAVGRSRETARAGDMPRPTVVPFVPYAVAQVQWTSASPQPRQSSVQ